MTRVILAGRQEERPPETTMPIDSTTPLRLSPRADAALVCPACRTSLVRDDRTLACGTCGERYTVRDGQADLRPRQVIRVEVPFEVRTDRPVEALDRVRPLVTRTTSTHDPSVIDWTFDETHGSRMRRSCFPMSRTPRRTEGSSWTSAAAKRPSMHRF
jgi:uncharacterized Zn finger protein (UPF0148 family)